MKEMLGTGSATALACNGGWATRASRFEPHPRIRTAIDSLPPAVIPLQNAGRHFGGHRTRVVELARGAVHDANKHSALIVVDYFHDS